MSSHTPAPDKGSRVRRLVGETGWTRARAIVSLGMVFGLGAVGTMAAWSDTAQATSGVFSTAAVNVKMTLNNERPNYNFVALKKSNLGKGDSVAGPIAVKNTGSSNFTYTVVANSYDNGTAGAGYVFNPANTAANAATFAQSLQVTIMSGGTSDGTTCTGGSVIANSVPLQLGDKPLVTVDQPVSVNQTDNLCVQVKLADAPVGARMSALGLKFNFVAKKA